VPQACGRCATTSSKKFAQDLELRGLPVAVHALNAKVTSKNDYAESMPSYVSEPIPGDTFTISSCSFGHPRRPGARRLHRVEGGEGANG